MEYITMKPVQVQQMVSARIPTNGAEFRLHLYHNTQDDKEHLALILGDVTGRPDVLGDCIQVFYGDVLGSAAPRQQLQAPCSRSPRSGRERDIAADKLRLTCRMKASMDRQPDARSPGR
jgi:GTP cyclohydrolase II